MRPRSCFFVKARHIALAIPIVSGVGRSATVGFVGIRKQSDQKTRFEINGQEAVACAGGMPTMAPDGAMTFSVVAGKTWTSQQDQQISRVGSLISLAQKYRPIIESMTSELPWRVGKDDDN